MTNHIILKSNSTWKTDVNLCLLSKILFLAQLLDLDIKVFLLKAHRKINFILIKQLSEVIQTNKKNGRVRFWLLNLPFFYFTDVFYRCHAKIQMSKNLFSFLKAIKVWAIYALCVEISNQFVNVFNIQLETYFFSSSDTCIFSKTCYKVKQTKKIL